jgi:hypothetical protein
MIKVQTLLSIAMVSIMAIELHGQTADSLQKSKIRYFTPDKGGRNKVWDFSRKLCSKKSFQVKYMEDSTGVLSVIEPGRISYYHTTPDMLILFGSENPLEKREYAIEKISRFFSPEYGDSVSESFRCEGKYCDRHSFREAGTTTLKVDAEGSIVLAENDTIRNVRRVHTIDAYSICMDSDSAALDTAKLTQVIDDRYEWYLPGAQYPIIENVTSTTYLNMDVLGTTQYAYCNLPENQVAYYITPDDDDETDEVGASSGDEQTDPDIIHYEIEKRGKVINISYDLDEEATITTVVASYIGLLCKSSQWSQNAGQGYSVQIDCNGLHSGIYILYINVNGKVYSEKVRL